MKIMQNFKFHKFRDNSYSILIASKNIILSLLIAIIIGTLLMICVYSINTDRMIKQVQMSFPIYKQENFHYSYAPTVVSSSLDNYTDAIIINVAAFKRGNNVKQIINNALTNPRYIYPNMGPIDYLIKAYSTDGNGERRNYGRYWHGYLIYIKPLLCFYSVSDIRFLNMCIQFILIMLLLLELYKKGGAKLSIPCLAGIVALNPISSALCFQYSSMYYITFISALILLKKEIYNSSSYPYFFLWIGIVTPFFDFLSYPLIGLGFNLLLFQMLTENSLTVRIKQIITASLYWIIGYIGMWSGKCVLATLLTDDNVIQQAVIRVGFRMNGDAPGLDSYTYFDVLYKNLHDFMNPVISAFLIIAVILYIFSVLSRKYYIKFNFNKDLSLVFVALFPFLWYLIEQNHSIVHHWMAHKNLIVTFIVIIYILCSSCHKISEKKDN